MDVITCVIHILIIMIQIFCVLPFNKNFRTLCKLIILNVLKWDLMYEIVLKLKRMLDRISRSD